MIQVAVSNLFDLFKTYMINILGKSDWSYEVSDTGLSFEQIEISEIVSKIEFFVD